MMDKAALPEPSARAEVGRYCWWPTQASSYLTGCLEILGIRAATSRRAATGASPPADVPVEVLREFHDAIASSGSLPLGLARRAVLGVRDRRRDRHALPLLLDVDTGIDDTLALLCACGSPDAPEGSIAD